MQLGALGSRGGQETGSGHDGGVLSAQLTQTSLLFSFTLFPPEHYLAPLGAKRHLGAVLRVGLTSA